MEDKEISNREMMPKLGLDTQDRVRQEGAEYEYRYIDISSCPSLWCPASGIRFNEGDNGSRC